MALPNTNTLDIAAYGLPVIFIIDYTNGPNVNTMTLDVAFRGTPTVYMRGANTSSSTGAGLAAGATQAMYERAELQQNLSSTVLSLHDLRQAYYGGKGYTSLSDTDNIRAFLQAQTGLTTVLSMHDLWRAYAVSQGVTNQASLGDMMKVLFNDVGLPS